MLHDGFNRCFLEYVCAAGIQKEISVAHKEYKVDIKISRQKLDGNNSVIHTQPFYCHFSHDYLPGNFQSYLKKSSEIDGVVFLQAICAF